jgi:NADH:ubiquinone oxidoreductase subunit
MGVFKNIFTWWEGSTFGTFMGRLGADQVGSDDLGTAYYLGKMGPGGVRRRMAIYSGNNDASVISPEWTAWLRHQIDDVPDSALPPERGWEKPPLPNLTGTRRAYRPAGALEAGGRRAAATGDYEAWSPE